MIDFFIKYNRRTKIIYLQNTEYHFSLEGPTGLQGLVARLCPGAKITTPLRGDLLQGQSDLVFDWFILLFGRRDVSHEQYTGGDTVRKKMATGTFTHNS